MQGQGWSMLEELQELITMSVVEVLITSVCRQTHNTIFNINLECGITPICTELNTVAPFREQMITMSPVLFVWLQHVKLS
jgi:hypothetical protein